MSHEIDAIMNQSLSWKDALPYLRKNGTYFLENFNTGKGEHNKLKAKALPSYTASVYFDGPTMS